MLDFTSPHRKKNNRAYAFILFLVSMAAYCQPNEVDWLLKGKTTLADAMDTSFNASICQSFWYEGVYFHLNT